MKKFFSKVLMVAVVAIAAVSMGSCKKLQPSEIDSSRYPYRATFTFTCKLSGGAPVANGTTVELICDGVHYTEKTLSGGIVKKTIGCTASGASMTCNCFVVSGGKGMFGSASASASSTNGFAGSAEVTVK
ncbi:MAG: hypothetical protein MJY67_06880 [Bacteroidales bacterium]|nr:hypothetical protein [Bacteroidales bacterium]